MTETISRFKVPELAELAEDVRERILAVQEKAGFVPNVFLMLAHRPAEFRAFFDYHDALMEKDVGLSKAEREMIVVATSAAGQCLYCVIAHGAILRIRAKNPRLADQLATNHRKAEISPRQRAMLDFAIKLSTRGGEVDESRPRGAARAWLRRRGDLGHRRDHRLLQHEQPAGASDRHAAQRALLPDGEGAEGVRREVSGVRARGLGARRAGISAGAVQLLTNGSRLLHDPGIECGGRPA